MTTTSKINITVQATVNAPVEKVWDAWTQPGHITRWNQASDDWHSPKAENDVRTGGKFNVRMEARDGSAGFDFEGVYDDVQPHKLIEYTMPDGRKVSVKFDQSGEKTTVTETFEAETMNSQELQRDGWQAILNNFKNYTESL